MRKATRLEVEESLVQLRKYLPEEDLALEVWGKEVRVIREDKSRPFGSNCRSYTEMYETIWFAINALRLANVKRQSD